MRTGSHKDRIIEKYWLYEQRYSIGKMDNKPIKYNMIIHADGRFHSIMLKVCVTHSEAKKVFDIKSFFW